MIVLTATSAQSVRLVVALSETGGTLGCMEVSSVTCCRAACAFEVDVLILKEDLRVSSQYNCWVVGGVNEMRTSVAGGCRVCRCRVEVLRQVSMIVWALSELVVA